jgi:hypothetical protein
MVGAVSRTYIALMAGEICEAPNLEELAAQILFKIESSIHTILD